MNVEDTVREAFRAAEGWRKKNGTAYEPREAKFETTKTGRKKWTGPAAYKIPLMLKPWQYVDLLHHLQTTGYERGLVQFIRHLIDKHVPRRAARPLGAGIPKGVSGEARLKMIAANLREASRLGHALDVKSTRKPAKRDGAFDATPGAAIPIGALRTKRGPQRTAEDRGVEVATSAAAARRRFGRSAPGRLRQANR